MTTTIFEVPELFGVVDAPVEAVVSLHAGEIAILGRLSDEELEEIGLSEAIVMDSIRSVGIFDEDQQAKLRDLWGRVREGDLNWITALLDFVLREEGMRDLVSLHWCLRNPYFDEEHLASGSLGTLLNTMLELSELHATVADVQAAYRAFASEIAAGKLSGTEQGLFFAGSAIAGGAIGYFTAGTGTAVAVKGTEWLSNQLYAADGWIHELAMECLTATVLAHSDRNGHHAIARKVFNEAAGMANRPGGSSSDKQHRMLLNAYRGLMGEEALPEHREGVLMPDLTGKTVKQAKRVLATMDLSEPGLVDGYQPDSRRAILVEENWHVVGQRPPGGTHVTHQSHVLLAFARQSEKVKYIRLERVLDAEGRNGA